MRTISRHKGKWLIVTDLDGTFLDSAGNPSKYNIDVAKELIKHGHKFCIITGRPWKATKRIYNKIGLDTIVANYNGGIIHNPDVSQNFSTLSISMSNEVANAFINENFIASGISNLAIEIDNDLYLIKPDEYIESYFQAMENKTNITYVGNDYSKVIRNPHSIMFKWSKEKDIDDLKSFIKTKYGDALSYRYWDAKGEPGTTIFEVYPKTASKGFALSYIASQYNIPNEYTMCFGDGLNDKEMLSTAGWGIAMKQARPEVKDFAKAITRFDNDHDGVAIFLDNFFDLQVGSGYKVQENAPGLTGFAFED